MLNVSFDSLQFVSFCEETEPILNMKPFFTWAWIGRTWIFN